MLGVAMLCLQAAIGTANDLADEPLDRGHKPGKPLPRGLLSRHAATVLAIIAAAAGLLLSVTVAPAVGVVAAAGLATGLIYDLRLRGTVWSWAPLAVGIPLLPAYAWLGGAGSLPPAFLVLLPVAAVAGAALAMANLLADLDRDRAAGVETAATRLGPRRTWALGAGLQAAVAIAMAGALVAFGGGGPGVAGVALGVGLVVVGLAVARRSTPIARERGWELQAAGLGLVAAGWLAALLGTPAL